MFILPSCTESKVETKILQIQYSRWENFNSLSYFFVKLEIKNNTSDTIFFLKEIEGEKNRYDINNFEYTFLDSYKRNRNSLDITLLTKVDMKKIMPHSEITFWITFEPIIYSEKDEITNSIPKIVDSLPNLKFRFSPIIYNNTNNELFDTLYFEADTNTVIKEILIEPVRCH
jgi:hypothetical protein